MTQDEIVCMAREAGAVERYFGNQLHGIAFHKKEWLERFFNLAFEAGAAHEREECAKVCDVEIVGDEYATALINSYADTIRARGEK